MAINYAPNYGNPWGNVMNQPNTNAMVNQNQPQMPQQNYDSLMTVLVQGESGANAYPVASGNTVMLVDFDLGKFWIKSNINGIPQKLRSFSFSEEIQEQNIQPQVFASTVSRDEFNNLANAVASLSGNVNKLIAELGGTDE